MLHSYFHTVFHLFERAMSFKTDWRSNISGFADCYLHTQASFLSSIIQHFKSSKKNIAVKSPLFHLINYIYIKKFVSKCLMTFY